MEGGVRALVDGSSRLTFYIPHVRMYVRWVMDTTFPWEVRLRRGEIGERLTKRYTSASYVVLLVQQASAVIKIASLTLIRSDWEENA